MREKGDVLRTNASGQQVLDAAATASDGSRGVDGTFQTSSRPLASSRDTKSEKVPPVSTVTRYPIRQQS